MVQLIKFLESGPFMDFKVQLSMQELGQWWKYENMDEVDKKFKLLKYY